STLMTGRMPSLHGVRHNGICLPLRSNTLVDLLRTEGYSTALLGKSHLQNFDTRPPPLKRGDPPAGRTYPKGDLAEAMRPAQGEGSYLQETPASWADDPDYKVDTPYYGFDHVDLCTAHGDKVGGNYLHWLRANHPDADALRDPENALDHDYVCPQARRTAIPEELYTTSYVGEMTNQFLERHAAQGDDQPFFAMMSFPDPHHPFTPPGKYWDMYKPEDMVLPNSFKLVNREPPPHVAWARQMREEGKAEVNSQSAFAIDEREAREAMALTLGSITMIDDTIGRTLKRLEELGMADDTVVIFTTDHGDYLGDHRLLLKGPLPFQGLVRVPFIWADTKSNAKPGSCGALAGTLDIGATILDRAGLEPYNGMQGRSLLGLAAGETEKVHDSILIEDDQQRTYLGFKGPVRLHTLVTQGWRITLYHDEDWGEMYDLANDPDEMENLWDEAEHQGTKLELMELLARRQMELIDRSPLPTAMA
ncbi:MAG: sulfatase-like hydrolase/transferase, partial [Rhodospirillales bacterium]|nr:sulfatase-like hydrolase/transferase [Rhodospirillales bacterium]